LLRSDVSSPKTIRSSFPIRLPAHTKACVTTAPPPNFAPILPSR